MFTAKQLEALFACIGEMRSSASNEGCESGLMIVDEAAFLEVLQETTRIKNLHQKLMLGRHEHRHGESTYLFLVEEGAKFDEDAFEQNLQEDFEPNLEERLVLEPMDSPTIIPCDTTDLFAKEAPIDNQNSSGETMPVMSKIDQLKFAYEMATPDWTLVHLGDERNMGETNIEIHDGYGRTATVYGETDAENLASASLMVLAQNLMPLLLEAVDIVRSNHVGNARAESLLAALDNKEAE